MQHHENRNGGTFLPHRLRHHGRRIEDFAEGVRQFASYSGDGGRKGSWAAYESKLIHQPTYLNVKTIDTTGAGDAFLGCCLDRILETGLENLTEGQLADMLLFANAAASIVTTRKGAIRSMPSREEAVALMAEGF